MTTEAASTPAPKRKGLIIAIAATLVVVIAGAIAWPTIAKRQKVSELRESAHEAFLRSDWLAAVSSLHEAAQLRPTDSESRRDYEDMQDKWLRYVEEVLSNKNLEEAYAFLGLDANKRIRAFLTEPVRTKFANIIEKNHQRAVATVKAAIAEADKDSTNGVDESFKSAHAALDKVEALAVVAQADFDKARANVIAQDWKSRVYNMRQEVIAATKGEGDQIDRPAYRTKYLQAMAQLGKDLDRQKYSAAATAQVRQYLQEQVDDVSWTEWQDKIRERFKEAGLDAENKERIDLVTARTVLSSLRSELAASKSGMSPAMRTKLGDDLTIWEYNAETILILQVVRELGAKVEAADFDAAFALYDEAVGLARHAEASEGRRVAGVRSKKDNGNEEEFLFTSEKFWQDAKAEIVKRMEAANLGKFTAAIQENRPEQAQLILDKYARITGRKLKVTGEALVEEKDLAKFIGLLVELNLSPAKGAKRTSYGDVFLVEKLRDRFAEPAAVQAFLAKAYAGWTRELLAERPGLALYTLKLGERATGSLDADLEKEVVAKFTAKYPQSVHVNRVTGLPAASAALGTPAWDTLTKTLQGATRGWINWSTEQPSEEEKDKAVTLLATLQLSEAPPDQLETNWTVRYQSGTQQVGNPDYQVAYDQLMAAQQEYSEAVDAANQAQSTLDQASASGNSNGAIWAGAAALTAKGAQGYAQGKRDNAQRALNATPRTLTQPAYADEPYVVIAHRRSHQALLAVQVNYKDAAAAPASIWTGQLRYSAQEVTGNAKHGVPVRKPVFLAKNVINERLTKQLTTQVTAQADFTVRKLAAALNEALTQRVADFQLPGGGGTDVIDFGWGRAALWQRGGLDLGFAKEEAAARGFLGLPADEVVLARPAPDARQSPGYVETNSIGQKFRPVPGTTVLFSQWETRVQDFKQFVDETGRKTTTSVNSLASDGWKSRGATWQNPGFEQDSDHPVVAVSWEDAQAFCAWLTKKERAAGRITAQQKYRLPTDREWGIAAGLTEDARLTPAEKDGKTKGVYLWGGDWPVPIGFGNYAGHEVANSDWPSNWAPLENYGDGYARTAPVGSFAPNALGLYDVGGNVAEICQDYYAKGPNRVGRDATFAYNSPELINATSRYDLNPTGSGTFLGFRVVLTLTEEIVVVEQTAQEISAARLKIAEQQAKAVPLQPFAGESRSLDDLKLTLLPVNPGYYLQIGMPVGREEEKSGYAVITRGFWLGQTEVTQAQWQAVMKVSLKEHMRNIKETSDAGFGETLPMYYVSWDEAMEFCRKLTERERTAGRLPAGYAYTLPTEAQWEFACRAGATTGANAGILDEIAWYESNSGKTSHPVGQKRPNAWGFQDMHGNVMELCLDYYSMRLEDLRVDPVAIEARNSRIERGGSSFSPVTECRYFSRFAFFTRSKSVGFRLALSFVG